MAEQRKYISKEEARMRLRKFCSYRDRCHKEVRTKLLALHVYGDTLEEIIAELIQDDFLNEERYAKSFVRGKFRMNHWGRNKIIQALKANDISDYAIRKGIEEIDAEEYYQTLIELIEKKKPRIIETDVFKLRKRLSDFVTRRGFEFDLIREALDAVLRK